MSNPYEFILSAIDSHLAVAAVPGYSQAEDDYWEFDDIEQLESWRLFFEAEPSRLQVLASCCRFATSHGLMPLEEVYLYAEIACAFGFKESEYFHNFCQAEDYERYFGCYHWTPVDGNEADFARTGSFEGAFDALRMSRSRDWDGYEEMAKDQGYLSLCALSDEDPDYLDEIQSTGLVMDYADEVSDMSEVEYNLFSLAYALLLQHDYSASLDVIQLLPALSGLRQVVVQ